MQRYILIYDRNFDIKMNIYHIRFIEIISWLIALLYFLLLFLYNLYAVFFLGSNATSYNNRIIPSIYDYSTPYFVFLLSAF